MTATTAPSITRLMATPTDIDRRMVESGVLTQIAHDLIACERRLTGGAIVRLRGHVE